MQLCRERIEKGELHPWQIDDPITWRADGHESPENEHRLAELFYEAQAKLEGRKETA